MKEIIEFQNTQGLKFVFIQHNNLPIVSANITYKVGSKNEKLGKTGLAHLCEHLKFEGTKNLAKGELDKVSSELGGVNNAYTTYDWTSYTFTMPSNSIETLFWLESDRLYNQNLNQEVLENQQSVVSEEIKQVIFNRSYGRWRTEMAKAAFQTGHPYSWEVAGSIEDVNGFTLPEVQRFIEQYYTLDNAVFTLAGNFDINLAKKFADKYFAFPTANDNCKIEIDKNSLITNANVMQEQVDNVALPAVFIVFHLDSFLNEKEMAIADILANLLGNGASSVFYNDLVYNKAIASNVGAYTDKRELSSLFTIYSIAAEKSISIADIIDEIFNIIANIKELLNYSVFSKALNNFNLSLASELQYSANIANLASFYTTFFQNPAKLNSILSIYNTITLEDIFSFVANKLSKENSVITIINAKE